MTFVKIPFLRISQTPGVPKHGLRGGHSMGNVAAIRPVVRFERIPLDKIGPYRDELRAALPGSKPRAAD